MTHLGVRRNVWGMDIFEIASFVFIGMIFVAAFSADHVIKVAKARKER